MTEAPETQDARAAETTPPPRRRRRRWPWVLLALVVLLAIGIRVALPAAVERGAAWGSRYYLGLPARIDNVDFDLRNGRVVVEGVTLGARPDGIAPIDAALEPPPLDPASALFHVDRVSTQLSWRALRDRTVRLTELSVEAPAVRIERESDGRVEPLRYAQPLAPEGEEPAPEPEPAEPSPPWKIAIDRFELRSPDVRLVDVPSAQDIAELGLEIFALDQVAVQGTEFELGGVDIDGPVLKVRRDLLLAQPTQSTRNSVEPGAPPAAAPAAPGTATTATAPPVAPALPPAAAGAVPASAPPPAKPAYRVAKIEVQRATFTWITENGPLDVAITLKATDVTAEEGRRFPLDLQLEIGEGKMGIVGDVVILPPSYTGKLTWSQLPIPRLLLASVPQFAQWLRQAKSSGDLTLDADVTGQKGAPALGVSGRLSFDALAVADPKGNEVTLGWKQLEVVLREVHAPLPLEGRPLGTTKAALDRVKLVEPKIRYTRPSPQLDALLGINLSGGAPPPGKKAAKAPAPPPERASKKPAAPAEGPIDLAIAALEMTGGEVEALDKTVKPVARTRIRGLSLQAKDVRLPAMAAANVRFQATLPSAAKLDVTGSLEPGNVGDFVLRLKQLTLPVFNPYASAAAGVTVDKGSASADVKLRMRGAKMSIDNRLVLHDLGVSMREPETFERSFGVPIDLALALLRDPQGNIALHIPVEMDEQGARIGVGAVIRSALKAAIVGAVTAPLKMVGAVFGGGDGQGFSLDPLPSVAGAPALDGDQQGRIDGLAAMLGERPGLVLDLRGRTGAADRPKVAEQILIERWRADKGLPPIEGTNLFSRRRIGQALERRAKGEATGLEAEDQALYERYVASVSVPAERLVKLATARAEVVRDALVAKGVPVARLAIGAPAGDAEPGVEIGFKSGS